MDSPVITLQTPEQREESISRMVTAMRHCIARADAGSTDARSAAMLIELMPVFLRFLDSERMVFIRGIKDPALDDPDEPLEEFLQMMTLPLVNMLGAALMTIAPESKTIARDRSHDMRLMLLRHVMDNFFSGVVGYLNSAQDQLAAAGSGNGKLHS